MAEIKVDMCATNTFFNSIEEFYKHLWRRVWEYTCVMCHFMRLCTCISRLLKAIHYEESSGYHWRQSKDTCHVTGWGCVVVVASAADKIDVVVTGAAADGDDNVVVDTISVTVVSLSKTSLTVLLIW